MTDMIEHVVIGGGCAGLACATQLASCGKSVLVVEKKNHLGGRTASFFNKQASDTIDNGQHLFLGCYQQTQRFLHRIGSLHHLEFSSRFVTEMMGKEFGAARLKPAKLPGPLHLLPSIATFRAFPLLDRLRFLQIGKALFFSTKKLKNMSVFELLTVCGQSPLLIARFWEPLVLATLNAEMKDISADYLVAVLRLGFMSSYKNSLTGLSRVGLSELIANPSQDFLNQHGGKIQRGDSVESIATMDEGTLLVQLHSGKKIHCQSLTLAIPPKALKKIKLDQSPILQSYVESLTDFEPSPIYSYHVWLDQELFESTYIGFVDHPIQWIFRNSAYMHHKKNCYSCVISARDELALKTKEEIRKILTDMFSEYFPQKKVSILHVVQSHEREATWIGKIGQKRVSFQTPLPNVFLAGDWTDTGLPCTIESAVLSGHLVADHLLL
ncbi:MAG: hydroxysqualene dehydroxylase HpnE [Bdellovibrionota bacterium]